MSTILQKMILPVTEVRRGDLLDPKTFLNDPLGILAGDVVLELKHDAVYVGVEGESGLQASVALTVLITETREGGKMPMSRSTLEFESDYLVSVERMPKPPVMERLTRWFR